MASYPDVPDLPGVPALSRDPTADPYQPPSLLSRDGGGFPSIVPAGQWGLYKDGVPVVSADTVTAFGYRQDWPICDYPLEPDAFQSYNKIQTPFDVRLRFVMGGTEAQRRDMLDSIATIAGSLELYDVLTPEAVYRNCNVVHYDYERRATDGVGLLKVDVWLLEVRQAEDVGEFSTASKSPSASSPVNGGTVQAQPSTAQQRSAISGASP